MKKISTCVAVILTVIAITACNKDEGLFGSEREMVKKLPGTIYWSFAGDLGYYDFAKGKFTDKMMKIGVGSSKFDAFDITWDNNKILLSLDAEGTFNFHERRFVLRNKTDGIVFNNLQDGNNLFDIHYEWEDIGSTTPNISPNEQYVALNAQHFSDMPITIIDSQTGNLVSNWMVPGVSFLNYGAPVWTADNTLYFRIGSNIYKSSPEDGYQSAPRVLAFGDEAVSNVTVNPQGTKFVFRQNKHLWMCNLDGSNLQQITTSETMDFINYDGESRPTFSPDGKYIAFTGATKRGTPWSDHDYPDGSWVAATGGRYGYIIVIPADGKLYNLDDRNSGAIWLRKSGSGERGVPCSGHLIWR